MRNAQRRSKPRRRSNGADRLTYRIMAALLAALPLAAAGLALVQAQGTGLPTGLSAFAATYSEGLPAAHYPMRAGWTALRGVSALLTTNLASPDRMPEGFPSDLKDSPGPVPAAQLASSGMLVPSMVMLGPARGMPIPPPPPDSRSRR